MFENVLEETYKLKAGDFETKYSIMEYIDDAITRCDIRNIAFLPQRDLQFLMCIYNVRKALEDYESKKISTYAFRHRIDEIKKLVGITNDRTYRTITVDEMDNLSDTLDIGLSSTDNEDIKNVFKNVWETMFEE